MRKWACAEQVDWATLMWLRDSLHRLDLLVKAAGLTSGWLLEKAYLLPSGKFQHGRLWVG